ncbi:MAG: recombinase RecA [SAR324 cluster bacterium]|nr:recombinase RecA [SAR324 cluster bacterium]
MFQEDKKKELELAIAQIDRQYGKGSIMKMDDSKVFHFPAVSTGIIGLDIALGGGLPVGRITEIYGPEGSGKTTVSLSVIAEVQKLGGTAAFIDAEHALDVTNARRLGVKIDELLLSQPDYGEQALEISDILVRSNGVDIVVVDSVAALVPKSELEGDMGDTHVGLQARLMSQALRKLTGSVAKSNTIFIFINQLRMKIGVMFGNPETTTGGQALKFYSTVRMEVRRGSLIKKGDETTGHQMKVKVVKNKVAPPFRTSEFDLIYNKGISKLGSLLECAVVDGVAQKSGTWYSYGSERLGQGRENSERFLEEHPDKIAEIDGKVREIHQLTAAPAIENGKNSVADQKEKKTGKDKNEDS